MGYGIRYVVVAAGTLNDPANEEDVAAVHDILRKVSPFKVTVLSERVSNDLTVALLRESGAFGASS